MNIARIMGTRSRSLLWLTLLMLCCVAFNNYLASKVPTMVASTAAIAAAAASASATIDDDYQQSIKTDTEKFTTFPPATTTAATVGANQNQNQTHESCSIESYHQYYHNTTRFQQSKVVPFTPQCLTSLIDTFPDNIPLRLGLVRRKYDDLQAMHPKRHVVWHCHYGCGGLGDRLQQAVNTFYLALAMNATFTIHMEYPVQWEDFFVGLNSQYDTTSAPGSFFDRFQFAQSYATGTLVLQKQLQNHPTLLNPNINPNWDEYIVGPNRSYAWFYTTNVEEYLFTKYEHHAADHVVVGGDDDDDEKKEVVIFSGSHFRMKPFLHNPFAQQFVTEYRLRDTGKAERTFIFTQLFMARPSPHLKAAIDNVTLTLFDHAAPLVSSSSSSTTTTTTTTTTAANTTTTVVGIQIRLGGGDWNDPARHGKNCTKCMADQARKVCKDLRQQHEDRGNAPSNNHCKLWLTSDSDEAIQEMKMLFHNDTDISVVVSGGSITHIDKTTFQKHAAIEQNTKTFLDWYVLAAYSDAFVLSRSSFSEQAAMYQLLNETHFKPAVQFIADSPCEFVDFGPISDPFRR